MSENEQEKKKVTNSNLDIKLWAVGSVLFILMSVFGYLAYLNLHFPPTERENYATLGDSFGILSSLFSGLAFAGLIVTIVMQNKTLKAQMEELELARKEYKRQGDELAGQKEVMNAQFQSIQIQQFETSFFKLIDNHRAVIRSNYLSMGTVEKVNGDEYINSVFSKPVSKKAISDLSPSKKDFLNIYYEGVVSIFIHIDKYSDMIGADHEKTYASLMKRYLNNSEKYLLLLMSFENDLKDLPIIEKYSILEGFDFEYVESPKLVLSNSEDIDFLDCYSMLSFSSHGRLSYGSSLEKHKDKMNEFYRVCQNEKSDFDRKVEDYLSKINEKENRLKEIIDTEDLNIYPELIEFLREEIFDESKCTDIFDRLKLNDKRFSSELYDILRLKAGARKSYELYLNSKEAIHEALLSFRILLTPPAS